MAEKTRLQHWNRWRKLLGLPSTLYLFLMRVGKRLGVWEPAVWRVRPRNVPHSLTLRLRGSSDIDVFYQIFVEDQYACLLDLENVSTVLDLGANIGISTAFFLSYFPSARVVAVEPDPDNFTLCQRNLKSRGDRLLLLRGAVWGQCTSLQLAKGEFGDGRAWASQVREPSREGSGDVEAWDVGSLIGMAGGGDVDLLKVDIEGAELVVFNETSRAWLPRIRNLCIELHGQECSDRFFAALANFDYELEHSLELTICRNIRAKPGKAADTLHRTE